MTTINVDVRIGGGQPPSTGGRGKSYVLYAPRTVVNTSAGKTIVPVPDRVELDSNGTASVTLDALPAETPYVFQFEVDNGYWKSSEIVAIVPASGTHKLADLVVLGDDFTPPAWYSKVLTAQQVVEDAAAEIPELVADAVTQDIEGRDLVDAGKYFPAEAAGGFIGQNGRATDLLVDDKGAVIPDSITRWGDRIQAEKGFVAGGQSYLLSGFAGENGLATELVVETATGNVPKDVLDRWASRMTLPPAGVDLSQVYSGPDILTVGDSLTASGNIASKLATLTGRTVRNMGVGGEGTGTIMGRLGVWPMMVTVAGGVIPASGAVDVSLVSSHNGVAVAPNLQGTGVRGEADSYLWGTIAGVRVRIDMRINDDGPPQVRQWQITRDGTGAPVTLLRPEPFIPEHGSARSGDIIILWTGQNDGTDTARSYAAFQALEQWMTKAGKRFLIASKPTGANTGWTDFEKSLLDRWGRRYINIRRFLIDEAMTLMGLTPTSQDLADIAAGTVPTSLRTDATHHTAAAQQCMAEFLHYPRLKELRFI